MFSFLGVCMWSKWGRNEDLLCLWWIFGGALEVFLFLEILVDSFLDFPKGMIILLSFIFLYKPLEVMWVQAMTCVCVFGDDLWCLLSFETSPISQLIHISSYTSSWSKSPKSGLESKLECQKSHFMKVVRFKGRCAPFIRCNAPHEQMLNDFFVWCVFESRSSCSVVGYCLIDIRSTSSVPNSFVLD